MVHTSRNHTMFRKIARIGHLLTFEHNAWRTNYTTVYVPASLVTLQLDKHGIVVSSIDNVWKSHHGTHEEAKKEFHEVLACIHPSNLSGSPPLGSELEAAIQKQKKTRENYVAVIIAGVILSLNYIVITHI